MDTPGSASRDISAYGCRDMSGNGFEWTGSVVGGDNRVPLDPKKWDLDRKSVHLRGQAYNASTPLTYDDLKGEFWRVYPYQKTEPVFGFRIVLVPDHQR